MTKCKSITRVERLQNTDVLKVSLSEENGDIREVFWFYNEADALKYIDHEVIVDCRKELYNGNIVDVISTFTVPTQINTLSKSDNIKLYTDAEDNFATVSFNDIAEGDSLPNARLYCVKQEIKSSQKATWLDLTVRDRMFHVSTLRLFAYDHAYDYTGHYIYVVPLMRTPYGLQTEQVTAVDGEVPANPEIDIAEEYILRFFADQINIIQNMSNYKLFEHLREEIDYEKGYGLVRLATELSLTEDLQNVINNIDIHSIQEAFVAEMLAHTQPNSILSNTVRACMLASKCEWTDKKMVIRIIDISEDPPIEREIFQQIKDYADILIRTKKEA